MFNLIKPIIYKGVGGHANGKIPTNQICGYKGCENNIAGDYWAILYEGEYTENEKIGAGTPVCIEHALPLISELPTKQEIARFQRYFGEEYKKEVERLLSLQLSLWPK